MNEPFCINCENLILDNTDYAKYRLTHNKKLIIKYNCKADKLIQIKNTTMRDILTFGPTLETPHKINGHICPYTPKT